MKILHLDNQQVFNVCACYSAISKLRSWVKSDLDYILDIGVNLNNYHGYIAGVSNGDELKNEWFFLKNNQMTIQKLGLVKGPINLNESEHF